jgi:hypothetical protein
MDFHGALHRPDEGNACRREVDLESSAAEPAHDQDFAKLAVGLLPIGGTHLFNKVRLQPLGQAGDGAVVRRLEICEKRHSEIDKALENQSYLQRATAF